jgi:hypothetical protein
MILLTENDQQLVRVIDTLEVTLCRALRSLDGTVLGESRNQ